jgi:hypothetical protein
VATNRFTTAGLPDGDEIEPVIARFCPRAVFVANI